jgi:hypothetical protein
VRLATHRPFSPKMSTKPSSRRCGNLGYFCRGKVERVSQPTLPYKTLFFDWSHVVERPVRGNADRLRLGVGDLVEQPLLGNDRGDTTGRETGGASTDQGGQAAHELPLGDGSVEGEEVREESGDGQELVGRVTVAGASCQR